MVGFPGSASGKESACQCRRCKRLWVWSLSRGDLLEEEMTTYSSILAWQIPWTEEPGWLQTMGSQRVRHDWVHTYSTMLFTGKQLSILYSFIFMCIWSLLSRCWTLKRIFMMDASHKLKISALLTVSRDSNSVLYWEILSSKPGHTCKASRCLCAPNYSKTQWLNALMARILRERLT